MNYNMQRILILGNAGSGKTFLGRKLADLLDLELIHLDYYFWQPGWRKPAREVWIKKITHLISKPKWVMDGNYSSNLELRLDKADTVIFLQESRFKCLWRCFRRYLQHRGRNRPDLQPGCPESLDLEFIRWIWNYPQKEKPEIFRKIKKTTVDFFVLKGKGEVAEFLQKI